MSTESAETIRIVWEQVKAPLTSHHESRDIIANYLMSDIKEFAMIL